MTKQILIDEDKVKLALEKYMSAFGQALEAHGIPFQEQQIMADRQAREALAQSQSDVKQEPKPFGYTLEETMKCWDLGYAAAVKALAKQEQPYADKAASVSNDRIKIDPVTGNVQIGAAKQEQGIDWKDMYEKEKRRSAMWSARYERDIGPLERATPQQEHVGEPVAWEGFTNFANPLGTRLIFTTKFEADEWLKDFVEGHAWLKPLSYTTPQPKQEQSVSVGEPVAWHVQEWSGTGKKFLTFDAPPETPSLRDEVVNPVWKPLFFADTTPYVATQRQQRKPLTDEQHMAEHLGTDVETYQKFKEWLANGFKE